MTSLFDIFRVFSDAEPLWLEAAVTLDDAMARKLSRL
jgi:hypothetical protein